MSKKTEKLIIVGVDGMDPKFTKYMVDQVELQAIKQLI